MTSVGDTPTGMRGYVSEGSRMVEQSPCFVIESPPTGGAKHPKLQDLGYEEYGVFRCGVRMTESERCTRSKDRVQIETHRKGIPCLQCSPLRCRP